MNRNPFGGVAAVEAVSRVGSGRAPSVGSTPLRHRVEPPKGVAASGLQRARDARALAGLARYLQGTVTTVSTNKRLCTLFGQRYNRETRAERLLNYQGRPASWTPR